MRTYSGCLFSLVILELEVLSSDIHKNYYVDSSNVLSNVALPDILLRKRALK